MRTIKFRGKSIKNKEWKHGNLATFEGMCRIGVVIADALQTAIEWWQVSPETVGQFTGLYDKNGKEIYEGDILPFVMYDKRIENYKIIWDAESASFDARNARDTNFIMHTIWPDSEIIGNIHDNPELLEVLK